MTDIRDKKDLEDWLDGKPRDVAIVIAARAALRVAPLLGHLARQDTAERLDRPPPEIVLLLLRAMATPWVAANCPTQGVDLFPAAYADAADAADAAPAPALWRAVTRDVEVLEQSGGRLNAALLGSTPLWPDSPLDWVLEHWQALKSELLSLDQDWDVWTRWYDDRLYGRPFNEAIEVARVSEITEEEWEQGPAVVNARIKEIEARFRKDASLEEALDAMAGHDRWGAGKRYFERRVAGDESDEEVAADLQTAQLHGELRRRADEFQERCAGVEENLGWVGEGFEEAVNRFAGSLAGETAELHGTIALLYDHTVELGSYLDFDRDLRTRGTGNQSPLDPNLRRAFESLIRAAAPFVRRFPTARMLDDEAGAFLARAELFEPAQAFVRRAGEQAVISPEDVRELLALLRAHTRAGDLAHKAKSRGFLSVRGLLAGIAFYYFGMVGGTVAPQSVLVRPVADLWMESEREIVALLDSLAPDQRHAILSELERRKALRPNAPKLEKTRETEAPKRLKDST